LFFLKQMWLVKVRVTLTVAGREMRMLRLMQETHVQYVFITYMTHEGTKHSVLQLFYFMYHLFRVLQLFTQYMVFPELLYQPLTFVKAARLKKQAQFANAFVLFALRKQG